MYSVASALFLLGSNTALLGAEIGIAAIVLWPILGAAFTAIAIPTGLWMIGMGAALMAPRFIILGFAKVFHRGRPRDATS